MSAEHSIPIRSRPTAEQWVTQEFSGGEWRFISPANAFTLEGVLDVVRRHRLINDRTVASGGNVGSYRAYNLATGQVIM